MFERATDFDTMASDTSPGPNLEDPHNDVHDAFGAIMADLSYSAFDPIL
jgi:hypothetical protein